MSRRVWSFVVALGFIGAAIVLWGQGWPRSVRHVKDYRHQAPVPREVPGTLEEYLKANAGPIDILLFGDSITQQWGSPLDTGTLNAAWKKHFGTYKTVNLGVAGSRTVDVVSRLSQCPVAGLRPRLVALLIGVNDLIFRSDAEPDAVAGDIRECVIKIRLTFPKAHIIVVKLLPAHCPGDRLDRSIRDTNAVLDRLRLDREPQVHVLDLTQDFAHADGTLKTSLFSDTVHISLEGYGVYAERLKPLVDKSLGGKGLGGGPVLTATKTDATTNP